MDTTSKSAAEGFEKVAKEAKSEAAALGHRALDAIDSSRQSAARGVENTADAIRSAADRLPATPREVAGGAAKMLDGTARYLRDNDPQDMLSDLKARTKASPIAFLLGAVAVGFLAGRMLRRG